jgi:hypothetical protein
MGRNHFSLFGKIRELGWPLQAVPIAVIKTQSSAFSKMEKTCRPIGIPSYCSTVGRTGGTHKLIPVSWSNGAILRSEDEREENQN